MSTAIKTMLGYKVSSLDNSISMEKPIWGEFNLSESVDEEGKPLNNILIRFDREADARELFNLIKDKMEKIPVLTGRASIHQCGHAEDKPCINWEVYVKE